MKQVKKQYESPQLTTVSFRVENGFTQSKTTTILLLSSSYQPQSGQILDSRGTVSDWTFGN